MTIEKTVSNDIDQRSSVVKSVFDCRQPEVFSFLSFVPKYSIICSSTETAFTDLADLPSIWV